MGDALGVCVLERAQFGQHRLQATLPPGRLDQRGVVRVSPESVHPGTEGRWRLARRPCTLPRMEIGSALILFGAGLLAGAFIDPAWVILN